MPLAQWIRAYCKLIKLLIFSLLIFPGLFEVCNFGRGIQEILDFLLLKNRKLQTCDSEGSLGLLVTVSDFAFGRIPQHITPSLHVSPPDAKPVLAFRLYLQV